MDKLTVLSIPVSTGGYKEFIEKITIDAIEKRRGYVCVANVHMLVEASKDPLFADVLQTANMVTPDGMPLTWAMRLLHNKRQDRVAGMDLLPDMLGQAAKHKLPVYFYGGTEEMLEKTSEHIKLNYPQLILAGMYSPPFDRLITNEEEMEIVREINDSNAAIVFVALGCPKQEKWMAHMKDKINAEMIGIGGALPVMVKMQKRAPVWMQNNGLEWLYRFSQEPRRLFKRYAVTNTRFVILLFKEIVRLRKSKKVNKQRRLFKGPIELVKGS